jgi:hypothetical protein
MTRSTLGALAITLACISTPGFAQYTPLFVIPVESASNVKLPAGTPARVRLTGTDSTLGTALGIQAPEGAPAFEYIIDAYPQLQARVGRTWLEPTFMIDFDEPVFAGLQTTMKDQSVKPERESLVAFVDRFIDKKNPRGWDLASTVATRREGDCTEHAVLTAALARLYGQPARVVVGIVLISRDTEHQAFGHAWAEMLEDGEWVVADAALRSHTYIVRYLPLALIEDEGTGYKMAVAGAARRWVQRVEVLGTK